MRLSQAFDGEAASGPLSARLVAVGRRLPPYFVPDADDPAQIEAAERGWARTDGGGVLDVAQVDLTGFASWAEGG